MLLFCCSLITSICSDHSSMCTSFSKVLTTAQSYSSALEQLTNSHLMAPVYYIIAGPAPDFGAVITRDRLGAADVENLGKMPQDWYLLETNYVSRFQLSNAYTNTIFTGTGSHDWIGHTLANTGACANVWGCGYSACIQIQN